MRMRTQVAALAVLVAVLAPAGPAGAATLKVPMDRFREGVRPIGTGGALVTPGKVFFTSAAPTAWLGYYKLRLPVGSRISGVSYYHLANPAGTGTAASLVRSRVGEDTVALANATSTASSPTPSVVEVPLAWEPGRSRKVRRGYTYYLVVVVGDGSGAVGARIDH